MPQYPLNAPLGAPSLATITTNASTQVATGPGVLTGFSVTGAPSTWVANVYDGTSSSGTLLYTLSLADGPIVVPPTRFTTGLFIVTSGTTPGSLRVLGFAAPAF